jgi:hypothetical protein
MDKKGNNFAAAVSLGSPASTVLNSTYTLAMVTNDLNNKLLLLQADPEAPQPTAVEFRVKAYINDSVKVLYSPVISATYTPYFIPIIYNKVYVPGAYQSASGYKNDWSPTDAPFLASLAGDGKYEGYVNFASSGNFKITANPDWNGTNYGDGGSGKLDTKGGDISGPAVGYYQIKVNTNDLSISMTKTSWSIIGSVIDANWTIDKDLTYNPITKLWTITTDLAAGEFKFRANHAWVLSYGSIKILGKLDQEDKNNIILTAAGNYTITLDFSVPPIYRYKIVKN